MTELITNITYYLISELVPNITIYLISEPVPNITNYLISEPVPNITNYLISEPVPDSLRESFLTYGSNVWMSKKLNAGIIEKVPYMDIKAIC